MQALDGVRSRTYLRAALASCAALVSCVAISLWATECRADDVADDECVDCHGDPDEEATIEFGDGAERGIVIDVAAFKKSVHREVTCRECHRDTDHEQDITDANARSYTQRQADGCRACHYAFYTRLLDGTHFAAFVAGNNDAPNCVDCHGSHDTPAPGAPRLDVSARCAKCHEEVFETYKKSVHGQSLAEDPAADVPICTDCHGAHAIMKPGTEGFHLASYKLCAECHGDAARMEPYGLRPEVVVTYLDDFHGSSNRLYLAGSETPAAPFATCSDCHGTHDIQPFRNQPFESRPFESRPFESQRSQTESRAAMREKVAATCRKCHEDASVEFGDAWLSHYVPTYEKAPLVWLVKLAYKILIPFIILGLVLHILLHLWRVRLLHLRRVRLLQRS